MSSRIRSVGLDVGTTSTQMVLSELSLENRASGFAVPEMEITDRTILYKSPVHFTPLLDESHIDGEGVRRIVEAEYRQAGITREDIQTGAVIITGETSRKENARAVLDALSDLAGDFVVATAGPDLESHLAAKGSGAVEYSRKTGKTVLHMDIGGGTSNLALIRDGEILDTGCINVGGRLVRFGEDGKILWISPALGNLFSGQVGQVLTREGAQALAQTLARVLEMAAGLREPDASLEALITREGKLLNPEILTERPVISLSGGVADCVETVHPWTAFGDLGPLLGQAIRESRLCRGEYMLGRETIRATVIGAGSHSTQLSGSTVFHQNIRFPLKNIPAAVVRQVPGDISGALSRQEGTAVLALPDLGPMGYEQIRELARTIAQAVGEGPVLLCLQQDMGKALGQALALCLGPAAKILCIDRVKLGEECYLDVGAPVGPAIPVVVKTLILGDGRKA